MIALHHQSSGAKLADTSSPAVTATAGVVDLDHTVAAIPVFDERARVQAAALTVTAYRR
jgi:hypothetical protein